MELKRYSISTYINFFIGIIYLVSAVVIVILVNKHLRTQALEEAEAKAKILLDRTMATHDYFTDFLKPHVFEMSEASRQADYFDPVWMSSTYANRMIDGSFQKSNSSNYYFKNCAINARSPENEASDYERDFIIELDENPQLLLRTYIKKFDGVPYFVLLRRGETMRDSCMPCHSIPDNAPKGLVNLYGPERSFHRSIGEVISAQSVRIPLSEAYAKADRFSLHLSIFLLSILILLFFSQYFLYRKLLLGPLHFIRNQATRIAENESALGEQIPLPPGKVMREMVTAFNTMSRTLRHHIDNLENLVTQRTSQLSSANEKLISEIRQRQKAQEEKEKLIADLCSALEQVKTLRGIIPICAHCKKIRDDEGFWNSVEQYISTHTEADLSHGICPDCLQKYHADLFRDEDP